MKNPDPDAFPEYALCLACAVHKHDKCWVKWADYLDGVDWRCNCWSCVEGVWAEAEDG